MRRCVAAASRLLPGPERPGGVAGLAAVWAQAAQEVAAILQPPAAPLSAHPSQPRGAGFTTAAAAAAASSEPQPAPAEEAPGEPAAPERVHATRRPAAATAGGLAARNCWQCGAGLGPADFFFCPSCDSIQPPDGDAESKYFALFGL